MKSIYEVVNRETAEIQRDPSAALARRLPFLAAKQCPDAAKGRLCGFCFLWGGLCVGTRAKSDVAR